MNNFSRKGYLKMFLHFENPPKITSKIVSGIFGQESHQTISIASGNLQRTKIFPKDSFLDYFEYCFSKVCIFFFFENGGATIDFLKEFLKKFMQNFLVKFTRKKWWNFCREIFVKVCWGVFKEAPEEIPQFLWKNLWSIFWKEYKEGYIMKFLHQFLK